MKPSVKGLLAVSTILVVIGGAAVAARMVSDLHREIEAERGRAAGAAAEARRSEDLRDYLMKKVTDLRAKLAANRKKKKELGRTASRLEGLVDDQACFLRSYDDSVAFFRGPTSGDVDGDGRKDRVILVGIPAPQRGICRYVLRVRTGSGTYRAMIGSSRKLFKENVDLGPFRELNQTAGSEILVRSNVAAAGEGYLGFTISGGRLVPFTHADGRPMSFANFLTVGVGGSVDCLGPGRIVDSSYAYQDDLDGFEVSRRFYAVSGATVYRTGSEHLKVGHDGLDRFPEITADPVLSSCGP